MQDKLEKSLKPLYKELLTKIETKKEIFTFCAQWGGEFTNKNNTRILFVGRATNGWINNSKDVEILFSKTEKRIFARADQMEWVDKQRGNKEGQKYNTNKSAFWRVIRKTAQNVLNTDEPICRIAWSNIYKVSYKKGNPDAKLKRIQEEICKLILKKEIELMSPHYVVFLTSGWEKVFLKYLNNGKEPTPIKTIKWGNKNFSKAYKIGRITYITSMHPQGKKEEVHANALIELIK